MYVMPSLSRFIARLAGVQLLMLLIEFFAFVLNRESNLSRLYWVPVSFALVACAGFWTVSRLPIIWGAAVGGTLAGITNLLTWPIGAFVLEGAFRFPVEASPLLVVTGFMIAAIVGAIVGVTAGVFARSRRRNRSRRSGIQSLAYGAFDEPLDLTETPSSGPPTPLVQRVSRR
jgi:hypothetical protein